ncbi:MAG: ABC transporter permease [Lachnospiraceae bacterium]|nr:ABC transporter permease [Lachnospiraceae bacterium]
MSKKKKIILFILAALAVLLNVGIIGHKGDLAAKVTMEMTMQGEKKTDVTVFYNLNGSKSFSDQQASTTTYTRKGKKQTIKLTVPSNAMGTRLDLGEKAGTFEIYSIRYTYGNKTQDVDLNAFADGALKKNDIASAAVENGILTIETKKNDPFIITRVGPTELAEAIIPSLERKNLIKNIVFALIFDLMLAVLFKLRHRFATLPRELIESRHLIFQLAKNDFRTRYAGSVLGITWAFVQPVITVLVYWFVFGHLGSGAVVASTGVTYPFVLWLICGLVPWFFFQDVLASGTGALQEYSYLVKKVVFKVSILPVVKEISALFVHLFFIGVMFILYICAGKFPDLYWLQVFYYSFALFIYGLGVSYITCSIVPFFRDLSQIISIIIQVQVWMTPIMWNMDQFGPRMPGWAVTVLKFNPMYYIVCGYRDAMMNKVWFWQRFDLTCYFWIITAVFFGIGVYFFKKLKVHFADVL